MNWTVRRMKTFLTDISLKFEHTLQCKQGYLSFRFPAKGFFSDPTDTRSSYKSKPRAFPRTDLRALDEWAPFNLDIDNAIHSAMQDQGLPQQMLCTVGSLCSRAKQLWNEEDIRTRTSEELHTAVEDVLNRLGIKGAFRTSGGGNCALIGEPDFSWVSTGDGESKLVVQCFTSLVVLTLN